MREWRPSVCTIIVHKRASSSERSPRRLYMSERSNNLLLFECFFQTQETQHSTTKQHSCSCACVFVFHSVCVCVCVLYTRQRQRRRFHLHSLARNEPAHKNTTTGVRPPQSCAKAPTQSLALALADRHNLVRRVEQQQQQQQQDKTKFISIYTIIIIAIIITSR